MTAYTLSILFFALKLIVNKLMSIEIVIFIFALSVPQSEISDHRKLPRTNMRKDLLEIMKLLFVQFWHLRFWRRRFLKI
jgi:hypothetical protein